MSTQSTWEGWAPYLLGAVGTALFVDLFLAWHETSVSVSGAVVVHSDSSAWAGWGAFAGVLLLVLLIWEASRLRGTAVTRDEGARSFSIALAVGVLAFTAIEFFAGGVTVKTGPAVLVDVHGRQWPAYVGLALAVLLVVVAAVELIRSHEERPGRLGYGVR
jgi:hypothetical protein